MDVGLWVAAIATGHVLVTIIALALRDIGSRGRRDDDAPGPESSGGGGGG
ncbi:hypothetical protein AB0425_12720 [Actinosynnema sp. NPDC051121]|nr:hypothetical protein [Saccharothrix sp.]